MPRRPLSDEFDPDRLEGSDFAESFENGEILGPIKATTFHQPADVYVPPPLESDDVAMPPNPVPSRGLTPKEQLLIKTNYSCQYCKVQLRDRPDLLHHHHPGQDKTTDDPRYTRLACLVCHQKLPNHGFMSWKYSQPDFDYVAEMRRKQNRR